MRLDHIAYRSKDRYKTADFFKKAFKYRLGTEFQIEFDDGSKADCLALVPPETRHPETDNWTYKKLFPSHLAGPADPLYMVDCELHAPPEIFVSDGSEGSIVGDWVAERGNVGGIHHIAYQVEDVEATMREWEEKGYAEFYSENPISCKDPDLTQVFTKPSELTGVIYEFISREGEGFCRDSVKKLMESTKETD
jgi:catechol 2,3-dioxygenase-like lactoylglutathione lyase family enzyme